MACQRAIHVVPVPGRLNLGAVFRSAVGHDRAGPLLKAAVGAVAGLARTDPQQRAPIVDAALGVGPYVGVRAVVGAGPGTCAQKTGHEGVLCGVVDVHQVSPRHLTGGRGRVPGLRVGAVPVLLASTDGRTAGTVRPWDLGTLAHVVLGGAASEVGPGASTIVVLRTVASAGTRRGGAGPAAIEPTDGRAANAAAFPKPEGRVVRAPTPIVSARVERADPCVRRHETAHVGVFRDAVDARQVPAGADRPTIVARRGPGAVRGAIEVPPTAVGRVAAALAGAHAGGARQPHLGGHRIDDPLDRPGAAIEQPDHAAEGSVDAEGHVDGNAGPDPIDGVRAAGATALPVGRARTGAGIAANKQALQGDRLAGQILHGVRIGAHQDPIREARDTHPGGATRDVLPAVVALPEGCARREGRGVIGRDRRRRRGRAGRRTVEQGDGVFELGAVGGDAYRGVVGGDREGVDGVGAGLVGTAGQAVGAELGAIQIADHPIGVAAQGLGDADRSDGLRRGEVLVGAGRPREHALVDSAVAATAAAAAIAGRVPAVLARAEAIAGARGPGRGAAIRVPAVATTRVQGAGHVDDRSLEQNAAAGPSAGPA